jgi:hypothetical protein
MDKKFKNKNSLFIEIKGYNYHTELRIGSY